MHSGNSAQPAHLPGHSSHSTSIVSQGGGNPSHVSAMPLPAGVGIQGRWGGGGLAGIKWKPLQERHQRTMAVSQQRSKQQVQHLGTAHRHGYCRGTRRSYAAVVDSATVPLTGHRSH
jgi:hypothetical protein